MELRGPHVRDADGPVALPGREPEGDDDADLEGKVGNAGILESGSTVIAQGAFQTKSN